MTELEQKRKSRRKLTGEDFTCSELVNEMLDKLPSDVFTDPTKTFCDPAAGNGNFLIEILKRKLEKGHEPLSALSTIFGVELQSDNVEEMKQRLLDVLPISEETFKQKAIEILNHNIVCSDAFLWDFENWKTKVKKSKALF